MKCDGPSEEVTFNGNDSEEFYSVGGEGSEHPGRSVGSDLSTAPRNNSTHIPRSPPQVIPINLNIPAIPSISAIPAITAGTGIRSPPGSSPQARICSPPGSPP